MELFAVLAGIAAVISALVAVTSNGHAGRSADASVRSAESADASVSEAKRSADAAEKSAELADVERRRAIERTDVSWRASGRDDGQGILRFTNVGITTAYRVSAVVLIGGERFDVVGEDIDSGDFFQCNGEHIFRAKSEANATAMREFSAAGIAYFPSYTVPVTARISWESELGTPFIEVIDPSDS